MAQQNSFDIVSQVDRAEIVNAINQTMKEVQQRFDFKGSAAKVALEEKELVLNAEDETKLRNMNDILQQKLVRRGVPLKAFSYGKGGTGSGRQSAATRRDSTGYSAGKSQRDREVHQGFKSQSAGCHSGRRRARDGP